MLIFKITGHWFCGTSYHCLNFKIKGFILSYNFYKKFAHYDFNVEKSGILVEAENDHTLSRS